MKKMAVVVMLACFACCLPAQLSTKEESKQMSRQKAVEIPISIFRGRIDLGEKYAIAAPIGSMINWTFQDHSFAVQFEEGAPFVLTRKDKSWSMEVSKDAKPYHVYKYTIAVCIDGKVLILDPIFVPLPPRG